MCVQALAMDAADDTVTLIIKMTQVTSTSYITQLTSTIYMVQVMSTN